MRANTNLMWLLGVFFLIVATAYTVWVGTVAEWDYRRIEWVGTVTMTLSAVLAFFLAFYLRLVHRAQGAEIAPDIPTAEIDDDDPEIGHFSPWSWWPLILASAIALSFAGIAIGFWLVFIAVPIILIALIGWTFEHYRGNFAR